jgi:outer membrane receptor protein involved in Fe transport
MGFYLQDEISISNRLTSRVGLRSSSHSARFPQSEADDLFFNEEYSQTFTALTGSITSIFRLDDNVSANFNVAQSFRAPNLSDLAKLGESKGDIYEIPNAQLKPERVINYEAGIKFFGSRIRSSVSAFYSAITDLITSADALYLGESTINLDGETYRIKSKQNSGRAFIRGLEASADFQLTDSIILRTNITSCYGHNSSAGEPVGGIPPAFGLVGIRRNFHRFHLDGFARFAGKQSRLSSDDLDDPRIPQGGTPAWVTINARGGLDISSSLSVQMALENVTDLNYREHGSGINGPGRNFIITLQWRN